MVLKSAEKAGLLSVYGINEGKTKMILDQIEEAAAQHFPNDNDAFFRELREYYQKAVK